MLRTGLNHINLSHISGLYSYMFLWNIWYINMLVRSFFGEVDPFLLHTLEYRIDTSIYKRE